MEEKLKHIVQSKDRWQHVHTNSTLSPRKPPQAPLQNNSTPNAQSRAGAIATPAINMCTAMRHRKGKKQKLLRKYIEYKHSSCEFAAKCVPVWVWAPAIEVLKKAGGSERESMNKPVVRGCFNSTQSTNSFTSNKTDGSEDANPLRHNSAKKNNF